MKILIYTISFSIFLISQTVAAGGVEKRKCEEDELLISLVDYSYCMSKVGLKGFNILGGNHTTIYITNENYEYSFARMPVSIALVDIPREKGISLSVFFKKLADSSYTENKFPKIRAAFDIEKNTIVSKFKNNSFEAYYIINGLSSNNSIYIFNDSSEYIYIVKGNINEQLSQNFLSSLKYTY